MSQENQIRPSEGLRHVKYEIRGRLARRAQELERQGYEIVPLNIGISTLNIYTQVGLITLVGLITKHGILMVEFANQRREEGVPKRQAIVDAAQTRLRPILMTTAAMVTGVMPLIIASGAGAKARFSIGLVIAAGEEQAPPWRRVRARQRCELTGEALEAQIGVERRRIFVEELAGQRNVTGREPLADRRPIGHPGAVRRETDQVVLSHGPMRVSVSG